MSREKIKVRFTNGCVEINEMPAIPMYKPKENDIEDMEYYNMLGVYGRFIWYYNDIIVKFNDRHYRQTEQEIELWLHGIDKEDKKHFPHVRDWKKGASGWIAEEMEPIRHVAKLSRKNEDILMAMIEKYDIHDIAYGSKNNYGIRNDGSLIIYDFGH